MEDAYQPAYDDDVRTHMPDLIRLGDRIPGGFFIYRDEDGLPLIYANDATLRIFGCETLDEFKELTGFTFPGLVHPDDYATVKTSIEKQISNRANANFDQVEYRIIRKDGNVRWVSDYGRLAQLADVGDAYYVFISDITDKYELQEAQLRMQMELEREHTANELKESFLFNMSHDIRTPLNAIMGFTSLAQRHADNPELLFDYLNKIENSSRQLLSLVDDMLEMNKLDTNNLELKAEPTNVREQLRQVLGEFRADMDNKHLTLVEELDLPDDEVLVDQQSLRRVFGNIVSNAVKFTYDGGAIHVRASYSAPNEAGDLRCHISVSDNGRGISEEFMERLFDAFEREETSTMSGAVGTGLGLAITKRLLDLMGGSISVHSVQGEGSTFAIELPLHMVHAPEQDRVAQASALHAPHPASDGPYRILIVEDNELNLMIAEAVLEEEGYLTESAEDGSEAVAAVDHHDPWYYDLILMDIQMPVMDGYEATRCIRAICRPDIADLPIVALSANAREEDRRRSFESGMNAHIAKPFDADELIEAVEDFAGAYRAQ